MISLHKISRGVADSVSQIRPERDLAGFILATPARAVTLLQVGVQRIQFPNPAGAGFGRIYMDLARFILATPTRALTLLVTVINLRS